MTAIYLLSVLLVLTLIYRETRAVDLYPSECDYKMDPWGSCVSATNTMQRKFELKSGNVPPCQEEFTITTTCHAPECQYLPVTGAYHHWGPCVSGVMERTDELQGNTPGCEQTRVVTKKC